MGRSEKGMEYKVKKTATNGVFYVEVSLDETHVCCQWFQNERDADKAEDLLKRVFKHMKSQ